MHLADTAFTEVERCTDFFHRQFLVVIEDDDQPLVTIESLGDQSQEVVLLAASCGILTLLVIQDIDFADVLLAVRLVPLLVETDQVHRVGIPDHFFQLWNRQFHVV